MKLINNDVINEVLANIELTTTQRKRAEELYTNLCMAISEKMNYEIDFYPQGSFATRTAVRPFKNGKDKAYDVDVICVVQDLDRSISEKELMDLFEEAISSAGYKNYVRWDKCFTAIYATVDNVEFSIDLIPAIPESHDVLKLLHRITEFPELVNTSISIPEVSERKHRWISNNAKGYSEWFYRQTLVFEKRYRDFSAIYSSSIESLPTDLPTNILRNVIKILKRLRDVYFYRAKSANSPKSIVITTLVAKLATRVNFVQTEMELLNIVVNELSELESVFKYKTIDNSTNTNYFINQIITYTNNEWELKNPANGLDNILSSWNEDQNSAADFFKWVNDLKGIIHSLSSSEGTSQDKRNILDNSLSLSSVQKSDFVVNSNKAAPWRLP
ncbi:SMODS domain-containing nucleotidyltransferase [Fundicoccus sp. Sow4_D5]|uniref:SMODS domain-containing nucleotidyltransferase n=1 Tax=Fundicoccus sp. Sow4_D5 TaxID=3438782 RepID=UPI003F921D29